MGPLNNQPHQTMYNPRFVSYARSHGRTVEEQLAHDSEEFPGGCMCGFILFIAGQIKAFRKARPDCFVGPYVANQTAFTQFIENSIKP